MAFLYAMDGFFGTTAMELINFHCRKLFAMGYDVHGNLIFVKFMIGSSPVSHETLHTYICHNPGVNENLHMYSSIL
jgi:hypothetical protein